MENSLQLFDLVKSVGLNNVAVVTDKLEFKVFEISTRIVAGSNPFISGSPYADLIYPGLSTGGRIALELKNALKDDTFKDLMT